MDLTVKQLTNPLVVTEQISSCTCLFTLLWVYLADWLSSKSGLGPGLDDMRDKDSFLLVLPSVDLNKSPLLFSSGVKSNSLNL